MTELIQFIQQFNPTSAQDILNLIPIQALEELIKVEFPREEAIILDVTQVTLVLAVLNGTVDGSTDFPP